MSLRCAGSLLLLPFLVSGCPAPQTDPPPPPRKVEIPTAPPHALGALAGGTDAAPRPESGLPGMELEPALPLPSDGGTPAPAPPPAPSGSGEGEVPDAPDAGMAL